MHQFFILTRSCSRSNPLIVSWTFLIGSFKRLSPLIGEDVTKAKGGLFGSFLQDFMNFYET